MQALSYKNEKFQIKEPFKGLFYKVFAETYKDENELGGPDEIITIDKKYLKTNNQKETKVGPSSHVQPKKYN